MKTGICVAILIIGIGSSIPLQRWLDEKRGEGSAVEEALYIQSGKSIKQASLGFEGLIADLYWLRTIQYFGEKSILQKGQKINVGNVKDWKLILLEPLINITTELDPQYLSAYRFGSLFLPDFNPEGAIRLARRAIQDNPEDWRLYQDLAFIYWKLQRYPEASETYAAGSKLPEAPKWMQQMSAVMLAKGGDRETARQMFLQIYETTDDPTVKKTSLNRVLYFRAEDEINFLNQLLARYREQKNECPSSLPALLRALQAGTLQKLQQAGMNIDENNAPLDPHGFAYQLDPSTCTVAMAPDSTLLRWKD